MVFPPKDETKIISKTFPALKLNGKELQFVVEFKYLGHILLHNMSDNVDIE